MQDSSVKEDCLHLHCHIVLIICHNSFTATSTLNASREQKFFIAYVHVFTRSVVDCHLFAFRSCVLL